MLEACLLIVERCFECKLLVEYYSGGDYVWMGLTLAFLWLPGLNPAFRFWFQGCDPKGRKIRQLDRLGYLKHGEGTVDTVGEGTHQQKNIKLFLFKGMLVPISSVIR